MSSEHSAAEIVAAARVMAEDLSRDALTAESVGPSLTCSEVDSVALVLLMCGQDVGAYNWIDSHVQSESEEYTDAHFEVDTAEYIANQL